MPDTNENTRGRDSNPDPITGEPGSHPIGVGVGAAGGGATGAAIGSIAGPIGTAVGAVIGAVAGGLAGKGVAEGIDPTAEDTYWRENHRTQPFAKDRAYDEFAPAYRTGYEGFVKHRQEGKRFEEAEPVLRQDYETHLKTTGVAKPLPWEHAKHAAQAAWSRVERGDSVSVPVTEEQVRVGKREVESGAVRLRKEVTTEVVNTPVELKREEIIVERVPAGSAGAVPDDAFREGEIRMPLKQEEAVVEKKAVVTGEVRVRKNVEHDTQNVQETVRKEEVHVDTEGDARTRKTPPTP